MLPSNMTNTVSVKIDDDWVEEKQKIFSGEIDVSMHDFDNPCVFRVPTTIAQTKPQAYAPQEVGLGPLHHHRLDLYTMQRKKIMAVVDFLNNHGVKDFQTKVRSLAEEEEYKIRASYHENLDIPSPALAWIIAIDAAFLLHFLLKHDREEKFEEDSGDEAPTAKLAADVMMLENQIPIRYLIWIMKITNPTKDHSLSKLIFRFYKKVSPLSMNNKLQTVAALMVKKQGHLLSILYHSILETQQVTFDESSSHHGSSEEDSDGNNGKLISFSIIAGQSKSRKRPAAQKPASGDEPPAPGIIMKIQMAVQMFNMVWGKITGLFRNLDPDYEANRGVDEIRIPSVLQLQTHAGIKIAPQLGGINGIRFDEGEKKLYLPRLTLNSNSEVVLRNLCAYEEAHYRAGVMCEYVDLMCGIVDDADDVKILLESGVIIHESNGGDVGVKEIVGMFSGKKRSMVDTEKKVSIVGEAIEAVNKAYGQSRKVRILRSIWKVVEILRLSMIFLLVLGVVTSLFLSAVCQFLDCHKL